MPGWDGNKPVPGGGRLTRHPRLPQPQPSCLPAGREGEGAGLCSAVSASTGGNGHQFNKKTQTGNSI